MTPPGLGAAGSGRSIVAPLGARAAHSLPVSKLKRIFATILYLLAAYMFWKGITS